MGWRCAVAFPPEAEMSVCSASKSQTDLYDQTASATVHWLLRNGLNYRNSKEKSPLNKKKKSGFFLFFPCEISQEDFKQLTKS